MQRELDDDLSDLIGGTPKTAIVHPPATYKPVDFTEPCKKCGGSGQFRGWSGRSFGACFACKGKGKLSFKTSHETRERSRATAAVRRESKEQEALEAFKVEQPAVWAWMDGSTFPFAVSLMEAIRKFGSLTENQLAAAFRCIAKLETVKAARVERIENAPAVTIDRIAEAFATATGNGLRSPRLRIAGFTFSPAKATSNNAGAIYVKQGSEYLGKVMAGKFICTRECGDERRDEVVKVANDPKAAAVAHGLKTGNCSCCGRELTDPDSIAAGIGPICATKYGW